MTVLPTSIIDTLNGLLEAEVNSVFRNVRDTSPYLSSADATLRVLMDDIDSAYDSMVRAMVDMIESLGGVPHIRKHVVDETQYMSFLSLKFLLPKLVNEKDLLLTRFENARATIGGDFPEVLQLIDKIEAAQRDFLRRLSIAAMQVTGGKFTAPPHGSPATVAAE